MTPTDLVQKYYVYGFGSEDMISWNADYSFQTTGNQTDIWSPYFLRPDTDHYPDPEIDPQVSDVYPSGGDSGVLPTLPVPLYGLMATSIETGRDRAKPTFPNGPYKHIYIFGGINEFGQVIDECRYWNITLPAEQSTGEVQNGVFSQLADMPHPRAYGQAVFVPGDELKIALVGGIDENGIAMNSIDVLTLTNADSPTGGTWETFGGTLPEALEACGAGYNFGVPGEDWVLTFGGWTGEEFNYDVYYARLGSNGDIVVRAPIVAAPRFAVGSGQAGASALPPTMAAANFNRYYVFTGVDENGSDSVIEVLSLP